MIKVRCPKCGKTLNVPDQYAGKRGKCPGCQAMLAIPASGASAVAAAPPKPTKPPPPPVEESEEVDEVEEVEEVDEAEPVEEVEADEDDRIAERPAKPRSRRGGDEDDEERVTRPPVRKRGRPAEDDDAPPRRKRKKPRGEWAECPNCGAADATRVHFTFWGGMIGPAIINTVRCNDCGTQYNGVHGDYNTTRILIYVVVTLVLAGVVTAVAVVMNAVH